MSLGQHKNTQRRQEKPAHCAGTNYDFGCPVKGQPPGEERPQHSAPVQGQRRQEVKGHQHQVCAQKIHNRAVSGIFRQRHNRRRCQQIGHRTGQGNAYFCNRLHINELIQVHVTAPGQQLYFFDAAAHDARTENVPQFMNKQGNNQRRSLAGHPHCRHQHKEKHKEPGYLYPFGHDHTPAPYNNIARGRRYAKTRQLPGQKSEVSLWAATLSTRPKASMVAINELPP